jgi:hypothetical protein
LEAVVVDWVEELLMLLQLLVVLVVEVHLVLVLQELQVLNQHNLNHQEL